VQTGRSVRESVALSNESNKIGLNFFRCFVGGEPTKKEQRKKEDRGIVASLSALEGGRRMRRRKGARRNRFEKEK